MDGMTIEQRLDDHRPIGFWLKLVDRLIDERFDAALAAHRLSRRHWQVLNTLRRDGTATIAEIDHRVRPFLDDDEPTTAPILTDLLDRKWATRDGQRFALSPDGAAELDIATVIVQADREQTLTGVDMADYRTTVFTLGRIARNLGWTSPGAA